MDQNLEHENHGFSDLKLSIVYLLLVLTCYSQAGIVRCTLTIIISCYLPRLKVPMNVVESNISRHAYSITQPIWYLG